MMLQLVHQQPEQSFFCYLLLVATAFAGKTAISDTDLWNYVQT